MDQPTKSMDEFEIWILFRFEYLDHANFNAKCAPDTTKVVGLFSSVEKAREAEIMEKKKYLVSIAKGFLYAACGPDINDSIEKYFEGEQEKRLYKFRDTVDIDEAYKEFTEKQYLLSYRRFEMKSKILDSYNAEI